MEGALSTHEISCVVKMGLRRRAESRREGQKTHPSYRRAQTDATNQETESGLVGGQGLGSHAVTGSEHKGSLEG